MKLVTCQQQGYLKAAHVRVPLLVDLVAEDGVPFSATFNLYDDQTATNLRGLWRPWSEFEEGEVTYVTPEGPESGDTSEHTTDTFGAWVALRRTQHAEPGKPGSQHFWAAMAPWALTAGQTLELILPEEESFNTEATVAGSEATFALPSGVTALLRSSVPYRVELRQAGDTVLLVARGQLICRQGTAVPPFVARAGETFEDTVKVFEDEAHRVPRSLEEWTVELDISGVRTLTEGSGLTVTGNEVHIELSAAEATAAAPLSTSCVLTLRKELKVVTALTRQFLFLA
jgi:hypothetical protein